MLVTLLTLKVYVMLTPESNVRLFCDTAIYTNETALAVTPTVDATVFIRAARKYTALACA